MPTDTHALVDCELAIQRASWSDPSTNLIELLAQIQFRGHPLHLHLAEPLHAGFIARHRLAVEPHLCLMHALFGGVDAVPKHLGGRSAKEAGLREGGG